MQPCLVERELDYKAQGFSDPCPVAELQQHHFTFLCLFSSHLWLQASESRNRLLLWADLMLSRKTHPHLGYFVPPNYNNFADFPQYFFSESLWLQQQTCSGRGGVNKHFNSQSAALFQRICPCPWNHNLTSRASQLCPIYALLLFQSAAAD